MEATTTATQNAPRVGRRPPRARAETNEPASNEVRVRGTITLADQIEKVKEILQTNDTAVISALGLAIEGAAQIAEHVRKQIPLHMTVEQSSVTTSFEGGDAGRPITRGITTLSKTAPSNTGEGYSAPIPLDPTAEVPVWAERARRVSGRGDGRRRRPRGGASATAGEAEASEPKEKNATARRGGRREAGEGRAGGRRRKPRRSGAPAATPAATAADGAAPPAKADAPAAPRRRRGPRGGAKPDAAKAPAE